MSHDSDFYEAAHQVKFIEQIEFTEFHLMIEHMKLRVVCSGYYTKFRQS